MSNSWVPLMAQAIRIQMEAGGRPVPENAVCSITFGPEPAWFLDGSVLDWQHWRIDAKLHNEVTDLDQGLFLVPSFKPEAPLEQYVVVQDSSTGMHHAARRNVFKFVEGRVESKIPRKLRKGSGEKANDVEDQKETVQMPSHTPVLSEQKKSMMPSFGSFPQHNAEASTAPLDQTISILGAFGGVLSSNSPSRQNQTSITQEPPSKKLNPLASSFEPKNSSQQLSGVPIYNLIQPRVATRTPLSTKTESTEVFAERNTADESFFEFFLTHSNETKADETSEPERLTAVTSSRMEGVAADLPPIDQGHLKKIDFLDLTDNKPAERSPLRFAELNLDVTTRQVNKFLHDADPLDDDDESEAGDQSWADRETELRWPVAPRQDAPQYEDCFSKGRWPSTSIVLSTILQTPTKSVGSSQGTPSPLTSRSSESSEDRRISGATDDLILVPKKRLSKNFWLGLADALPRARLSSSTEINQSYHALDIASTTEPVDFTKQAQQSPKVQLPASKHRIITNTPSEPSSGQDRLEVVPSSIEEGESLQEKALAKSRDITDLEETQAAASEAPSKGFAENGLKSLDLEKVFGGSDDWGEKAEAECEVENPNQKAPGESKTDSEGSEVADGTYPLTTRDRIPVNIINDFNAEFAQIWHAGREDASAYMYGDDEDEVSRKALDIVNLRHKDAPIEIMDMVKEFNGRYAEICREGPLEGGAWPHDTDFSKFHAVAVANTEWYSFSENLKDLPREPAGCHSTLKLEAAKPSCAWCLQAIDAKVPTLESTIASAQSEKAPPVKNVEGDRFPHHVNFNGDWVFERSETSPEISLFAISTTKWKHFSARNKPLRLVHLKSVLTAQAFKYVDPVQYMGTDAPIPFEHHGEPMSGSKLRNHVTGEVEVIYPWSGSWVQDSYTADDSVPRQAMDADRFHYSQNPEYIFQHRPYVVSDGDLEHDLCNINDDHVSRSVYPKPSTPLLKSRSSLRNEVLADDIKVPEQTSPTANNVEHTEDGLTISPNMNVDEELLANVGKEPDLDDLQELGQTQGLSDYRKTHDSEDGDALTKETDLDDHEHSISVEAPHQTNPEQDTGSIEENPVHEENSAGSTSDDESEYGIRSRHPLIPMTPFRTGRFIDSDKMLATPRPARSPSPEDDLGVWEEGSNGGFLSPIKPAKAKKGMEDETSKRDDDDLGHVDTSQAAGSLGPSIMQMTRATKNEDSIQQLEMLYDLTKEFGNDVPVTPAILWGILEAKMPATLWGILQSEDTPGYMSTTSTIHITSRPNEFTGSAPRLSKIQTISPSQPEPPNLTGNLERGIGVKHRESFTSEVVNSSDDRNTSERLPTTLRKEPAASKSISSPRVVKNRSPSSPFTKVHSGKHNRCTPTTSPRSSSKASPSFPSPMTSKSARFATSKNLSKSKPLKLFREFKDEGYGSGSATPSHLGEHLFTKTQPLISPITPTLNQREEGEQWEDMSFDSKAIENDDGAWEDVSSNDGEAEDEVASMPWKLGNYEVTRPTLFTTQPAKPEQKRELSDNDLIILLPQLKPSFPLTYYLLGFFLLFLQIIGIKSKTAKATSATTSEPSQARPYARGSIGYFIAALHFHTLQTFTRIKSILFSRPRQGRILTEPHARGSFKYNVTIATYHAYLTVAFLFQALLAFLPVKPEFNVSRMSAREAIDRDATEIAQNSKIFDHDGNKERAVLELSFNTTHDPFLGAKVLGLTCLAVEGLKWKYLG